MSDVTIIRRSAQNIAPERRERARLPVSDVLRRVLHSRGVQDAHELSLELAALLRPHALPDIERAAQRLERALADNEHILIVGDFDADGATSVALCLKVLEAFGAQRLSFLVPNRFDFGYGLSPAIVELAAQQNPDVLLTVDNGVSSNAGVARANELGIDVIITDHHLPPSELPAAHAIVNPNLADSRFGSPNLAGVGVAYYLMSVLRGVLRASGWFAERAEPNMADYLDLVALGTVADLVPLDHNNRILVQQGMRRIRAGRCRPGITALCRLGKRDPAKLVAADLGYAVGPRLNAAGRLDDMSIGIRCLLSDDPSEALQLAQQLDDLNRERRELQARMQTEAELIVAAQDPAGAGVRGLCIYDSSWHQGIVGLVAGKLKDKLARPVIAFADASQDAPGELKGSARSISGLHIRDLLDRIATQQPGLIDKFGGHAMAAGLSLKKVHYAQFARAFDAAVHAELGERPLNRVLYSDGELAPAELTLDTAYELAAAGPWGQNFPEPQFDGEFRVVGQRVVGEKHLKLTLGCGDGLVDAIAFNAEPLPTERARLVYRLQENDYGPLPTLQLVVEHVEALA